MCRRPYAAGGGRYLDVCVEEQLVGTVGKPESLNVLQGLDVVQHHVGGNEVDSQAQSCPPGHNNGEDSQPDSHLNNQHTLQASDFLPRLPTLSNFQQGLGRSHVK